MKYVFLILLLPLILAGSCKKDGLTHPTQSGANTFSCKINGNTFKPCKAGLFSGEPLFGNVTISSGLATARVYAQCTETTPYKSINIEIQNFKGPGEYLLSDFNSRCLYEERYPNKTYTSELTLTGKIVFTNDDRVNFILSGKFEFVAANKLNPNEKVSITDGRFDIKY